MPPRRARHQPGLADAADVRDPAHRVLARDDLGLGAGERGPLEAAGADPPTKITARMPASAGSGAPESAASATDADRRRTLVTRMIERRSTSIGEVPAEQHQGQRRDRLHQAKPAERQRVAA